MAPASSISSASPNALIGRYLRYRGLPTRLCVAEPGFVFEVVDAVIEVEDADSIAAMWLLEDLLGRRYGGSSGTNLVACLQLAATMRDRGESGSIVTLLCDRGERYAQTLFDRSWLAAHMIDPEPGRTMLAAQLRAA